MEPLDIFFNIFVVCAFVASFADHFAVGQGFIIRPLRAFLLSCFIFTEGYLAVRHPVVWFYVALNFWGLFNLFYGKKVPLRWRRKFATTKKDL